MVARLESVRVWAVAIARAMGGRGARKGGEEREEGMIGGARKGEIEGREEAEGVGGEGEGRGS